jgi:hypothetical protein
MLSGMGGFFMSAGWPFCLFARDFYRLSEIKYGDAIGKNLL